LPFGGLFGGGHGSVYTKSTKVTFSYNGGGGGLGYRNNVSVTSGTGYTVVVGATPQCCSGGIGAVRIVWPGCIRSFPSTSVNIL
jgi:hypothetical protein